MIGREPGVEEPNGNVPERGGGGGCRGCRQYRLNMMGRDDEEDKVLF